MATENLNSGETARLSVVRRNAGQRELHTVHLLAAALLLLLSTLLCGCGRSSGSPDLAAERRYSARPLRPTAEVPPPGDESATQLSVPELPLSLEEAISTALANNPEAAATLWRIEQSRAALKEAEARFWPQFSFYTEYLTGDAPSAYLFKTIDQRQLPPGVNFNDPGSFDNFESGLEARLNLYAGGADVLQRRMADKDREISEMERQAVINDLVAEVIRSYYDTLAARDFIAIAEESVATVTEQLRIMRVRYEGGAVLKSDVLSMEVRLAQAREQLVASRQRLQLSLAALANLLGLEPNHFAAAPEVLQAAPAAPFDLPKSYDDGLVRALTQRPELQAVRLRLEKSRLAVRTAEAAYLPRLDAQAKYYLDDPDLSYDRDRENWTAALLLGWDLFRGFSRPAAVDRAEARLGEMRTEERKAYLAVSLDVKKAYLGLEEARARYSVAASSVDSAEESFRLVREHYRGGAVPVTRYLEAELDRSRARTRVTAARYDRMKADAEVARALGRWARQPQPEQPTESP